MSSKAIVLAAFGVSKVPALNGITNILEKARQEFSDHKVTLAFTSNQIRHMWKRRASDSDWREANPGVPDEIYNVRGPLAAVADLQDGGYRNIVVQPLHIYAGEEFADLKSMVDGLNSIRTIKPRWMPFKSLSLGRPALGMPGPAHPYGLDLEQAARALEADAVEAIENSAILVYAGHGNPYYSTGVYVELEQTMRKMYSGLEVMIGVVEGSFGLDYVQERLERRGKSHILLKPLMLVAGEHAMNDICGDDEDSWRCTLENDGHNVFCRMQGLGECDAWADIYLSSIRETLVD